MDDKGPLTGVLPKLEVLAPLRPASRHKPRTSPPPVPNSTVSNSPDGSSLEFGSLDGETWEPNRSLLAIVTTLPSWLVSFIVHLALILALATYTFVASSDGTIILEVSQVSSDSPSESISMEITLEEPELEDEPFESLESDEVFEEPELPTVDLSEVTTMPEIHDIADPFSVAGLPEFSSKPASDASPNNSSEGIEFFGTRAYGSNFVFVIDCSSSMSVNYRWDRAVEELIATLDQLDSKQKFLVLLYNDQNYVMFGAGPGQKLIPANRENKRRIKNWLDEATPFAGTKPGDSMKLALRKKPDAIYFLSDGELRDRTLFDLRFWNVRRKGPDGEKRLTPIHTVLLGSLFGRKTMRTIAEENNGIFTHVR